MTHPEPRRPRVTIVWNEHPSRLQDFVWHLMPPAVILAGLFVIVGGLFDSDTWQAIRGVFLALFGVGLLWLQHRILVAVEQQKLRRPPDPWE